MSQPPKDGMLELVSLPTGHTQEARAVSALPARSLLYPSSCDFPRQFSCPLGVESGES